MLCICAVIGRERATRGKKKVAEHQSVDRTQVRNGFPPGYEGGKKCTHRSGVDASALRELGGEVGNGSRSDARQEGSDHGRKETVELTNVFKRCGLMGQGSGLGLL